MFENFDWIQAMRNSPVMIIILACSVVTLGFAIERLVYFGRRRGNPESVAKQVLENSHLAPEQVEEKMQIALSEQRLQLERNLGWLGTMGNTAPLIGLLGTVWGIMRAFHDMARTGSAGPSVVAAGIAEALFTTAAGLLVAVPAVMLFNHFVRRMTVMLTEAENHARRMRLTLEARASPPRGPSQPAAGRVMAHSNGNGRPAGIHEPNLTPLIDVSLVLVVILL